MRIAAAILMMLSGGVVQANNIDAAGMFGTWNVDDAARGRIVGPIVVSETQISWTAEDGRRCAVHYRIESRVEGSTFPGGPMVSHKPDDAYTTFKLVLDPQDCERNIASFTISLSSDGIDLAHFAAFSNERGAQGYGVMHRAS